MRGGRTNREARRVERAMSDLPDYFAFCDVRWNAPDKPGEHVCAEHLPDHEQHICCCGERRTP